MNKKDKENLYRLFRQHERLIGSSRTTIIALHAFINSINEIRCTRQEIEPLIMELSDAVKNSEPKIIPLIHLIEQFETEMRPHFKEGLEQIKDAAARILWSKMDIFNSKMGDVTENGIQCVDDGDAIIVHSVSTCVTNILAGAKTAAQKKIRVLVLQQDLIRTRQLIKTLVKAGIEHQTIPVYNLNTYVQEVNKLFIGGLSVTPDRRAVTAAGTANIVSLCHTQGIPTYLFVNSLKFSHKPGLEQQIFKKEERLSQDRLSYTITTHSHDLVDLDLIDHVITEYGEMGASPHPEHLLE